MTCVVGFKFEGRLFLGGDSYISQGNEGYSICSAPKVYQIGTLGVGICGSVLVEQILESSLKKHVKKRTKMTLKHFQEILIPKIKKDMTKGGCLVSTETGVRMIGDSCFVFAIEGQFYKMEDDFSLWDAKRSYVAIGSGAVYALGAMEAIKDDQRMSPGDKVFKALEASTKLCSYVRPPYTLIEIGQTKKEEKC
jgi:ATP-dependent protease HslVU (ClpYQ) peptidase subunit